MGFFKRHKVWSVFLGILVVLIVGSSLFLLVKSIVVSNMDFPKERHYVTFMTGVVEPALPYFIGGDDLAQMREDNMNTFRVYFSFHVPSPFYQIDRMLMSGLVKEAKKQGLAVHVAGQPGPFASEDAITEKKIDLFTKRALELAELSEECGVEYFTPLGEADHAMGRNRAIAWHAEILPQIREVFSGKVLAHWSCYGDDDAEDISPITGGQLNEVEALVYRVTASKDFDGVMLSYPIASLEEWQLDYFWDPTKEKEPQHDWRPSSLEEMVLATSAEAEKLGLPIYVGEFHFETKKAPGGGKVVYSEEEQAEAIARFIDIVAPHYDGIIHCFWTFTSGGIKGKAAEQVIKEKFGALP